MSELYKSMRSMSETLFESTLARASDIVLTTNQSDESIRTETPVLSRQIGSQGIQTVENTVPAMQLLYSMAEQLDNEDAIKQLMDQYSKLDEQTVRGIALGLEIAGLALNYYVLGTNELEDRKHFGK